MIMKKILFVLLISFSIIFASCTTINSHNSSDYKLNSENNETKIGSTKTSWIIKNDKYSFTVQDDREEKIDISLDGYYVIKGNKKFCFEIRGDEARWTEELEEYKDMYDTVNRKLYIGNFPKDNGDIGIILSFEGDVLNDTWINCQEFVFVEDDIIKMIVNIEDPTVDKPKEFIFIRHTN